MGQKNTFYWSLVWREGMARVGTKSWFVWVNGVSKAETGRDPTRREHRNEIKSNHNNKVSKII